jgi:[ribosomal protein S5]-alanine N-acetyltransferase
LAEQQDILPREIVAARLSLRPFASTDANDVAAYANDERWSQFLPAPFPYSLPDAETFIAGTVIRDWNANPVWAMVLDRTVIGGINLRLHAENHVAEMGWSIASSHWGKGFATEAARAVVDAAFTAIPTLARIAARANVKNRASIRVMEKVGMTHEATLRCNLFWQGQVVDEVHCGILREEWCD